MRDNRKILLSGLILLLCVCVGCTAQSEDAPELTEESGDDGGAFAWLGGEDTVDVPAGTQLMVRLEETVSTETNESGDQFRAALAEPVVVDGKEVLPSGASVTGRIIEAIPSGRVRGRASIQLTISEIEHGGERYSVSTDTYRAIAEASTGEDAATIGAGAGIGAVVGAVLGGGDGAAKGAAIGGGGGTAVVLSTKGDDIEIPAGTRITFALSDDVEVTP